jgi:hypothetical protein
MEVPGMFGLGFVAGIVVTVVVAVVWAINTVGSIF